MGHTIGILSSLGKDWMKNSSTGDLNNMRETIKVVASSEVLKNNFP